LIPRTPDLESLGKVAAFHCRSFDFSEMCQTPEWVDFASL
jgi:hypothetical protein